MRSQSVVSVTKPANCLISAWLLDTTRVTGLACFIIGRVRMVETIFGEDNFLYFKWQICDYLNKLKFQMKSFTPV